jgi:hypothetical protein
MDALRRNVRSVTSFCLAAVLLSGCQATTVTPTFPTGDSLVRPDRVLVYDFGVTPSEFEIRYGPDTESSRGTSSQAQAQEELQVGKAFAKALTDNLVGALRSRGIDSYRASEAAPPGQNTASIKGRFVRVSQTDRTTVTGFGLGSGQVRTHIQIFQGTGLSLRLVAEAETSTSSKLKPGLGPTLDSVIEGDAKRTAAQVAEKIADYYKRQGWIE